MYTQINVLLTIINNVSNINNNNVSQTNINSQPTVLQTPRFSSYIFLPTQTIRPNKMKRIYKYMFVLSIYIRFLNVIIIHFLFLSIRKLQRNEIYIYLRFQHFIYMKDVVYKDDVVHICLSMVQFLNNYGAHFNEILHNNSLHIWECHRPSFVSIYYFHFKMVTLLMTSVHNYRQILYEITLL